MQWPKSEPMWKLFVGHSVTSRNTYTKNRWVRHEFTILGRGGLIWFGGMKIGLWLGLNRTLRSETHLKFEIAPSAM